jgi:ABC-type dipeptide/oligopeptide/nickel transport system ATPase component
MPKDESLLEIKNLRAYYSSRKGLVKAVDNVSLDIQEGECVGLLGESGCGKTSLAYAIIGLFDKIARVTKSPNGGSFGNSYVGPLRSPGILGIQRDGNSHTNDSLELAGMHGKIYFRGKEITTLSEEEMLEIRGEEITMIPQG